jgi:hypothetical protein
LEMGLRTIFPGWPWSVIHQILAFQVAGIKGTWVISA